MAALWLHAVGNRGGALLVWAVWAPPFGPGRWPYITPTHQPLSYTMLSDIGQKSSSSLNFCFFIWIFHLDPSAPGSNALSDWLAGSTNAAPAQLCPVRLDVLHLLAPRRAAAAPRYGGPVVSHAHRADSAICLLWSHLAGSLELVGVRDRARRCPQQDWGHNIWTLNPDPPTLTL